MRIIYINNFQNFVGSQTLTTHMKEVNTDYNMLFTMNVMI